MDEVEVEDISDKLVSIGIAGPKAAETLTKAGIDVAQLEPGQVVDAVWQEIGISVARNAHPQMDGYEIWLAPENVEKLWDALVTAGATPVGSDALEMYRIARGVPRYGIDLRERDLPQETGQEHALNFTKGCYIGQEIVERIRSRGNVHRTLHRLRSRGRAAAAGNEGSRQRQRHGRDHQRCARAVPGGERHHRSRISAARSCDARTAVQIGEQSATVKNLPFEF